MQSHDKTAETLEEREKAGTLETRISMMRTQVVSLSERNEALENRLASIRLTQAVSGRGVYEKPAVEERGSTPPRDGKWWLAEKMVALASVTAGGLCVLMVWMGPARSNNDINKGLVAARARVSALETKLETQVKVPVEQTGLLKSMLSAKDAEVQRLRLDVLRMRREIEGLRSDLSSLEKEKDKELTSLEESVAWMKEKNREEIGEIKLEKDKEIKALQGKIEWLNTTKAVAIPGLINALDHQDMSAKTIIARTLSELTGKSFGTDQEKWRKWWRRNRLNFIRH